MPRGIVYKVDVDEDTFKYIINKKNFSIRKLGKDGLCDEKTIRRNLKDGKMKPALLDRIAEHINVDLRLLSGEIPKKNRREITDYDLNDYPYYRKKIDDYGKIHIDDFWERLFLLFELPIEQFYDLDKEKQLSFQEDVLYFLNDIIMKYFGKERLRDPFYDLESIDIIDAFDSYKSDYYARKYADEHLRKELLNNIPIDLSEDKIKQMSPDDIIDYDINRKHPKTRGK